MGKKGGGLEPSSYSYMALLIMFLLGLLFIWYNVKGQQCASPSVNVTIDMDQEIGGGSWLNPYSPPVVYNDLMGHAPYFNIPTQPYSYPSIYENPYMGSNLGWRQYGMLTSVDGGEVLPLMGRETQRNRNKFQYYTISNQHNNIKLPITVKGKNGLDEYGVDEVSGGETVLVNGHGQVYTISMYPNGTML